MSRSLSLTMRMAANAQETGEVIIALVTVTHPSLDAPIRLSSDPTQILSVDDLTYGTVSRGDTYLFLPLKVTLPEESDDAEPGIQLVIDNVSREVVPVVRSITSPAQVTVELVLASDPDNVEVIWPDFDIVTVDYNASDVTIDLKINALTTEPYPSGRYRPGAFGGLF